MLYNWATQKIGKPWDIKELGLFITCVYLKSDKPLLKFYDILNIYLRYIEVFPD